MKLLNIAYTLALLSAVSNVMASNVLPSGARILHGKANIIDSENDTFINSTTARNVISWNDFSVGSENTVSFDDKSYLNLVRGNKASIIEGKVLALPKGSVYLVNPNGITLAHGGEITSEQVVLSTSKLTEQQVNDFKDKGELKIDYRGMGKVKIIGDINTENLIIDGSQVIIADADNLKTYGSNDRHSLSKKDGKEVLIKSSTSRIDIGGKNDISLKDRYNLSEEDGVVDHLGWTSISTKDDFLNIPDDPKGKYFITNDIDLGEITSPVNRKKTFEGKIDGAFNRVSYILKNKDKSMDKLGLFSEIKNASVENLGISSSTVIIRDNINAVNVGALAGSVSSSELKNIEVTDFNIDFDLTDVPQSRFGALSGVFEQGPVPTTLNNVSASFGKATAKRFLDNNGYKAGVMAAENQDRLQIQGAFFDNSEINSQDEDTLPLLGISKTDEITAINPDENNQDYIDADGRASLIGFYAPFFVGEDVKETFDKDNPRYYDYTDTIDNPYFKTGNYVDLTYDYSGHIGAPGTYHHNYTSYANGTRFYFDNGSVRGGNLTHTIEIEKIKEEIPEPLPEPAHEDTPLPEPNHEDTPLPQPSADDKPLPEDKPEDNGTVHYPVLSEEDLKRLQQGLMIADELNPDEERSEIKLSHDFKGTLSIFSNLTRKRPLISKTLLKSLEEEKEKLYAASKKKHQKRAG